MHESRIYSLMLLPFSAQYVITLEAGSTKRLVPIWIGVHEGNAIALQLQGETPPRPLTHDLMLQCIKETGCSVERVCVVDLNDNTYYAVIELSSNGGIIKIDSRPSDAIALALKAKAPIFVSQKVLDKCPVVNTPFSEEDVDAFKKELQNMSPEDFFKRLGEQT